MDVRNRTSDCYQFWIKIRASRVWADLSSSLTSINLSADQLFKLVTDREHVEILKDALGRINIPTWACFSEDGELKFGHDCVDSGLKLITRDIRRYVDLLPIPGDDGQGMTLLDRIRGYARQRLGSNPQELSVILENGRKISYTPAQLLSGFLGDLQARATLYFNQSITAAFITVPFHFTNDQRAALRNIGTRSYATSNLDRTFYLPFAGPRSSSLHILRLINHPTALAYAHGLMTEEINLLTYHFDLEDLTEFEVATALVDQGVIETFGSACMRMEDRLEEWLWEQLGRNVFRGDWRWYDTMSSLPETTRGIVSDIARKARRELFASSEDIVMPIDFQPVGYPNISISFTKTFFYGLYRDLLLRTVDLSMRALREAAVKEHKAGVWDLHKIILSGKSSTDPPVINLLSTTFPHVTIISHSNDSIVSPETAAVIGTARIAATAYSDSWYDNLGCIRAITSMDISVQLEGGLVDVIIPRNTVIPTQKIKRYNITTNEIRIYGGFGRYTNNTVFLGIVDLPLGDAEIIVKAVIGTDDETVVNITVSREGSDATMSVVMNIPSTYTLWSEDDIAKLIDEAVAFDQRARGSRAE